MCFLKKYKKAKKKARRLLYIMSMYANDGGRTFAEVVENTVELCRLLTTKAEREAIIAKGEEDAKKC